MKKEDLERLVIGQQVFNNIQLNKNLIEYIKPLLSDGGIQGISVDIYKNGDETGQEVFLPGDVIEHALIYYIGEVEKEIKRLEKKFENL